MGTKRSIARNVAWNWAGMCTDMLAGFLVAPFLVHQLGATVYGLWVLVASLTGYFGLLDLGMRASVGRQIAFYRAKGDFGRANQMLSTAFAILSAAAVLALVGTLVILLVFMQLLDVPAEQVHNVRLALLLVGINLAIALPLSVFDAALWAAQRFDLLNSIDIPSVATRAALTFYLISQGHGLVALGALTLGVTIGNTLAKLCLAFYAERHLALRPTDVNKSAAKELFGYGVWSFILSSGRILSSQIAPVIVGSALGVQWVTLLSIAARMTGYANNLFSTGIGVLTPVATALYAEEDRRQQKRLFLLGSRYCAALVFCVVTGFILLGRDFIQLWMGPSFASAAILLTILILGESLPMCGWVGYTTILSMGRHKVLAIAGIIENVAAIVLALLLVRIWGIVGVCVAIATAAFLCRGVVQIVYACRVTQESVCRFLVSAVLPPVAVGLPAALGFALLESWRPAASWMHLFATAGVYALAYFTLCGLVVYLRAKPVDCQVQPPVLEPSEFVPAVSEA